VVPTAALTWWDSTVPHSALPLLGIRIPQVGFTKEILLNIGLPYKATHVTNRERGFTL